MDFFGRIFQRNFTVMAEQLEIPYPQQKSEYNSGRPSNHNDDPDEEDDIYGAVIRSREESVIRYT